MGDSSCPAPARRATAGTAVGALKAPAMPFYWPSMWPIPCYVNGDCKVNILDLIFIRNRLNTSY